MSDERVRKAQWEADIEALYCPDCGHPHSYHVQDRGCTMPLNSTGQPLGRSPYETPTGPCYCKETDDHKMARLERVRDAAYAKFMEAFDAQAAFAAEIAYRPTPSTPTRSSSNEH